jgi:hypothetical protein
VVTLEVNGEATAGAVRLGEPRLVAPGEAVCELELVGLDRATSPTRHLVHGADTLQALALAHALAGARLLAFIARGGRVLMAGDDADEPAAELPLEAYFPGISAASSAARAS